MEKTRITVTTHFDGTEDATALFSEPWYRVPLHLEGECSGKTR